VHLFSGTPVAYICTMRSSSGCITAELGHTFWRPCVTRQQLLSASKLEPLRRAACWGFQCHAPLSAFTALVHIIGASGRLPRLPPCLETLSWAVSFASSSAPSECEALQVNLSHAPVNLV
jgi:hypothetical protein